MQPKAQTLNCSTLGNMTLDCYKSILSMMNQANNEVWTQYKKEHKMGADMYTVVILGLFASVLICLLYRSMKRSDSVDDQARDLRQSHVTSVLYADPCRLRGERKTEKEDERGKGQDPVIYSSRSSQRFQTICQITECKWTDLPYVVFRHPDHSPPFQNAPHRARSYQGYLPEIVVTDHQLIHNSPRITVTHSQPMTPLTRHSSSGSYQSQYTRDNGSDTGSVFLYPEGYYEYSDSSQ